MAKPFGEGVQDHVWCMKAFTPTSLRLWSRKMEVTKEKK